jgi:hypothetical protein
MQSRSVLSDSDHCHSNPPFVGRKRELSSLGAALNRARAGFGSIFLLSGGAGVGKTRLANEFADLARTGGAKVLEGRADARLRDAAPFEVWKEILSNQPRRAKDGSDFLPMASSPALTASTALQPFSDRQTHSELIETTGRALVEHARTQPLVLILDDLYVADPLSLRAFRVFARALSRVGTVVIGVYRDSKIKRFQEFVDLLADPLVRDCKRISLAAFDDEEMREFVESRIASALEEGTLRALHALTGGNPGFLDIAFRHGLLDETPLRSEKWLGGSLRVEIEAHLEHLSQQARDILSTGSLAGVEFKLSFLFHVLEQDPGELLDSLHEAENSGLLTRTEIPGTYRFRQRLVQKILNAEITGARRARLHRRFGEVLESLYPNDDAFAETIASHFYEAVLIGCAEKAADYCSRAAALARNASRVVDAQRFYQMTLSALELHGTNANAIRGVKIKLAELSSDNPNCSPPELAAATGMHQVPSNLAKNEVKISPGTEKSIFSAALPPEPTEKDGNHLEVVSHISDTQENTFRREGDFWTLVFQNQALHFKHSHGLLFVAHLLQHPDLDFHVAQLVALLPAVAAHQPKAVYISRSERERMGIHSVAGPDSNPLLDATAKAEYRRRIEELRDELEQARRFNDHLRAADLEKELEFIGLELSRAVGADGRDRKHRAENERARVNVTNAIRTLTQKIAKEQPSFGRYLRLTIQTGTFCSYRPDPVSPTQWRF